MRITSDTISRKVLQDINSISYDMQKVQQQLSSGDKISKPSDDPAVIGQLLMAKTTQAKLAQYTANMTQANQWLTATSDSLTQLEESLLDIIDTGSSGTSDLLDAEAKKTLGDQVNELLASLIEISNSESSGKYIFGGTQTLTAPFTAEDTDSDGQIDTVTQNAAGTDGDLVRSIGQGQTIAINIKGSDVFMSGGAGSSGDIFKAAIDLREALYANDTPAIEEALTRLQDGLTQVTNQNAVAGSKLNRLETTTDRYKDESANQTEVISNMQDSDYAETYIKYQQLVSSYTASLQVASNLMQMSLVNFL